MEYRFLFTSEADKERILNENKHLELVSIDYLTSGNYLVFKEPDKTPSVEQRLAAVEEAVNTLLGL